MIFSLDTVNSLLRGMELSQLKRSVDSQLSNIDISMFTKPAERDDDDVDKKITEWLASINAKIPMGAQVKKDSIPKRNVDSDKALENLLQIEVEKEVAEKKAQFKKSVEANEQTDIKSKQFIEKLFAEAEEKKSNIPKEVAKEIPKLKAAKKSAEGKSILTPNLKHFWTSFLLKLNRRKR